MLATKCTCGKSTYYCIGGEECIKSLSSFADIPFPSEESPAPSIKGMRWVPCKERLPEDAGHIVVKVCQKEAPDYLVPVVMERFMGQWVYETEEEGLQVVEWLDETPSLPSSPNKGYTKEDLRGFTKWLMNMYMPVKGGWRHRGAFGDKFKPVHIETLMDEYIASLPNDSSKEEGCDHYYVPIGGYDQNGKFICTKCKHQK